jgi:hypothetical protein
MNLGYAIIEELLVFRAAKPPETPPTLTYPELRLIRDLFQD